jgi:ABC-type transport system substrate-binding protein
MLPARALTAITAAGSVFLLSLTGCAPKPENNAGTLYLIGGDFKGFDPIDSGDTETAEEICRVYEGLMEYSYLDRPFKAIPRLAEAMPEISADGLMYTFHLKHGVRFSDDKCFPNGKGREVTANDFIYSFKRLLHPKNQSDGDWIFIQHVLGAKSWAAKGDFAAPIPGFVAPDNYTLQIKLAKPYPQLLWVLTMSYAFVVPREAVECYGDDFRGHPVGTGPFRLVSWRRRYRTEYERNPAFSGQTYPSSGAPGDREAGLLADAGKPLPILDRIVLYDTYEFYTLWQMFLAGQIAVGGLSKDYFEKAITPQLGLSDDLKRRGIRLYKTPEASTWFIGFNMKDAVVGGANKKLRQAFACAIDAPKMCEVIYNNRYTPANSPVPPGIAGHTDKPYAYSFNLARAKKLIAEAGYPGGRDKKGNPLRLTMIIPGAGSTEVRQLGDFLVDQLSAIGVELVPQILSFNEYLRREHDGYYQLVYAGWIGDYPDAENFLKLFYSPNKCPGVNVTNYENPAFDQLYERITVMPDSPERTALYEQMAEMAMEDCPWALLTYPLTYGLYQPWFQNYKRNTFSYASSKYFKVLPH